MLIDNFDKLNKSFKHSIVFRIGREAGFFSEYNNMLLAILYCIDNSIKFKLYSKHANFCFKFGWRDYFLPFCEESNFIFHKKYNYRSGNSRISDFYARAMKVLPLPYLTQHTWAEVRNHRVPKNNYNNFFPNNLTLRERLNCLHKMIWRYNTETDCFIRNTIQSIEYTQPYIGLHVRGGDKVIEHQVYEIDKYIMMAENLSTLKRAFVLTDDYNIYEQLKQQYPLWEFKTLCLPEHKGYFLKNAIKSSKEVIRRDHLRLFASIDILEKSKFFIGTFSSNPGMHLGIRKMGNCYGIDSKSWNIW